MKAVVALCVSLLSLSASAADDKSALCILCHGTNANGNPSVRAPKLSGVDRAYLSRQLEAFRSGVRGTHAGDVGGSEMRTVALSLRPEELSKALDVVVAFKPAPSVVTVQGDVSRGEQLYQACAVCHGARGEGNPTLQAPTLANGSDWYFVMQLNNFRSGWRGTHADDTNGAPMRAAAIALPDDKAVVDVVSYINTLR